VVVRARVGDRISGGEPLAEIHARTEAAAAAAEALLRRSFRLVPEPVRAADSPYETVG
jgi:thymidine phosphorylase